MYALLRAFMRFMTGTYLVGLFRLEGLENVPRTGALIVCPNHFATLDPPMVPAFLPRIDSWSMAKSEYFQKPWMRWLFTAYHAFPVVRHTADRAALRRSFDLLKSGEVLIMFPEGTRVEGGVLAQPEPGAGFIAQKAACPVLPVALTGTRECMLPVTVRFGKPFLVRQRRASGDRITHEEAADAIMLKIAELLPADKRGAFSDLDSLHARLAGVVKEL